jgi:PAS domain S-box/diguanylate cyclase (GGDEF) domain
MRSDGVLPAAESAATGLLDALFDNAAIGLLVLDRDMNVLRIGQGLCNLLGYRKQEVVGRSFTHLLHPDDRLTAQLGLIALERDRGPLSTVERRYLHKDGSVVWILGTVSRIAGRPEDGEPVYVAQITPITKQKEAEAAAAEAIARWNFALEGAGQGVWDCDLSTRTWFFSPAWKRLRGIPEDEDINGQDDEWLRIVHPEDRARVTEIVARVNGGELDEVAFEYRERNRQGQWIWIMARGRCVEWTPDGRRKRIIGTDTDITEIKQRELDLADMSGRLTLALSTSKVGIWEADLETLTPTWDDRTREIFGCDPSDFDPPRDSWEALLHPEDREAAAEVAAKGAATRTDYSCSYRIVRPDGEIRHIRTYATFTRSGTGAQKMIGINWDVTADVERASELERANRLAEERNQALEAARAAMEHASLHDSLTGLPNRRCLDKALSDIAETNPPEGRVALLHIDLDRFKQINDTKGHAAGDAMLVYMADLLRAIFRKEDVVARIGGDEFVVMLSPAPNRANLGKLVERVIERANVPMTWEGHECRAGASVGIAEAQGRFDPRQLLVNADIALYRAKNKGRNCAAYFTDQLQAEIIATKQCGDDILKGLEQREFIPYYQPQFCARSLDIVGVEALARWRHETRGLLKPEAFLTVAEDLNAVAAIDRMIMEHTLADLALWDELGVHVPKASVNVSARRLTEETLIENLATLTLTPGRLSFELLESIFLDESDEVLARNLAGLRNLGINIEIDDFGTGHASIVGLMRLSPERLKIDRQIIAPITGSEQQRRLVHSIIEIGRSLGIRVCAEGVETAEHVEILRDLGCDSLQGYYFGQPMPGADLCQLVRERGWHGASCLSA